MLANLNSTCSYIERVSCPGRVHAGNTVDSNQCIDAQYVLSIHRRSFNFKCVCVYIYIYIYVRIYYIHTHTCVYIIYTHTHA